MRKTKNHKKEKASKPKKFGGFLIQKRTDSIGRNYYVDKAGKKRKQTEYKAQWSSKGRASNETVLKVISQIKKHEITDLEEVKLIANDYETLRNARPLRQKEIEIMESESKGTQLFFRTTDTIRDAIKGGATIKILSPDGKVFRTVSDVQAMEIAHRFIDAVTDSLEDINKASDQKITSPMIQFNFEHDVEKNIFYLDFKNLSGFDDFVLLSELIRDNFEA